jgi:ferritin-like metal-binding protein YciE
MPSKEQQLLTTYLGDQHALMSHILQAIDKQVNLLDGHPDAREKTIAFRDATAQHVDELQTRLNELGGSPTHPVKTAVAAAAGVAAGLIDKVRASEAAKDLRDDYTAINHAIIAYEMLFTTAAAAGDDITTTLAKRHLQTNARFVMDINNFMPKLVLDELREDGLPVQEGALERAEQAVREIWNQPPHTTA